MKQTTISMLTPQPGRLPAYDRFFRGYSLLMATNAVTHHLVHEVPEPHLAAMLGEVATASEADYEKARVHYAAIMLSFSAPQLGERRSLDLADVARLIETREANARKIILTFQNFNEFILLFALFEDAIKELLATGADSRPVLKEPAVMERLLTHLQGKGVAKNFQARIVERTICRDYEDAKLMWNYFVTLRHLYVHAGGRPTAKWIEDYESDRAALAERMATSSLIAMDVRDLITEVEARERVLFMLPDGVVNVFRNYVVAVMEAVYLASPHSGS